MIEVELRGKLDELQYQNLQSFLIANGKLIDSHDREMFLLRDGYEGYSDNPLTRELDIRLRNSDGRCEIMMKRKASDNNVAREEISIGLSDKNLKKAKQLVKAFGCITATRMHRIKETYLYNDVEWSVVKALHSKNATADVYYFEAEQLIETSEQIRAAENFIREQALQLQLTIFSPEEMREFLEFLDDTVNEAITL